MAEELDLRQHLALELRAVGVWSDAVEGPLRALDAVELAKKAPRRERRPLTAERRPEHPAQDHFRVAVDTLDRAVAGLHQLRESLHARLRLVEAGRVLFVPELPRLDRHLRHARVLGPELTVRPVPLYRRAEERRPGVERLLAPRRVRPTVVGAVVAVGMGDPPRRVVDERQHADTVLRGPADVGVDSGPVVVPLRRVGVRPVHVEPQGAHLGLAHDLEVLVAKPALRHDAEEVARRLAGLGRAGDQQAGAEQRDAERDCPQPSRHGRATLAKALQAGFADPSFARSPAWPHHSQIAVPPALSRHEYQNTPRRRRLRRSCSYAPSARERIFAWPWRPFT